MEVAAFHPPTPILQYRGLVSVALFVTSPCQGVTLHPALRSPDFPPSPLTREQRLPGRLPLLFYRPAGPEMPLIVVEIRAGAGGEPAGIAENRQRRHVARRGLLRQRAQPGLGVRVRIGAAICLRRREDHLAGDSLPRLERLLERGVAQDRKSTRLTPVTVKSRMPSSA